MKIALAVMPFLSVTHASLGVSLLKSALESVGHACDVFYFNLRFGAAIGFANYSYIAETAPPASLLGDWLFSGTVFPGNEEQDSEYVVDVLLKEFGDQFAPEDVLRLLLIRDKVPRFLEDCLAAVSWQGYDLVGFTTSFHQNGASLGLAKRIKEVHPRVPIVFGGANCEGKMGEQLLASFDFIDYVCSGEGDQAFPRLVQSMEAGEHAEINGIIRRIQGRVSVPASIVDPVVELDDLPYPRFDDYYAQLKAANLDFEFTPLVPFETSRGCWWGAKHHCTFCGLNGSTMDYRSKSAQRALAELAHLSSTHGSHILCVDNILDTKYFQTFLPDVIDRLPGLTMHYEVKANLSRLNIHTLARAGVTEVQPGIESFLTSVLHLMNKGTTRLLNIQMMRWCRESGVNVAWNFIYGFPGEDPAAYDEVLKLIPLLAHLDAPQGCGRVRADRHSPYFMRPQAYGVHLTVRAAYRYVYALEPAARENLAYYFSMDFEGSERIGQYEERLRAACGRWMRERKKSLSAVVHEDRLQVADERDVPTLHKLSLSESAICFFCDTQRSRAGILRAADEGRVPVRREAVVETLEGLVKRGLLISEGDHYLTLVVFNEQSRRWASQRLFTDSHDVVKPPLAPWSENDRPRIPIFSNHPANQSCSSHE